MKASRTLPWRALAPILIAVGSLAACGRAAPATRLGAGSLPMGHLRVAEALAETTTTTTTDPTTTDPPHVAPQRAARVGTRPPPAFAAPAGWWPDTGFWQRLSYGCESSTGTNGNGGGFFQFSPDTARAVGYRAGMTWDEQRGLADRWLARIGGAARGGTTSGWPRCWWVALRG